MMIEQRHRVALLIVLTVFYVGLVLTFAVGGERYFALSTALIGLVVLIPMARRHQRQRATRRPPVTSSSV